MLLLSVNVRSHLHSLHCLGVVAHREEDVTLADVGFDELRVNFDRFFGVLESLRERSELCVRVCTVVVPARVLGVAFDGLGVRLDCTGKISSLEQSIAFFTCLVRLFGREICKARLLGLGALCFTKLVKDVGGAVLRERLLEVFNCSG